MQSRVWWPSDKADAVRRGIETGAGSGVAVGRGVVHGKRLVVETLKVSDSGYTSDNVPGLRIVVDQWDPDSTIYVQVHVKEASDK